MHEYRLKFTLHSDATFGRGEGIAAFAVVLLREPTED